MANPTVRQVICEAVTDGLSPETAAAMLLEPSKWQSKLFDPARDLATVYKQYLRGDLGVGMLSDAVEQVLAASNDMADLTDSVIQTYGQEATPEDVPEQSMAGEINVEDEKVEVLVRDEDEFVSKIIEHVNNLWPAQVLQDLYEQGPGDIGPPRRAGQGFHPSITSATMAIPSVPATRPTQEPTQQPQQPQQPPTDRKSFMMRREKIRPETLEAFEKGQVLNHIWESALEVMELRRIIKQRYDQRAWGELAQVYQTGGELDERLGMLAGDLMVLNDLAGAAVRGGYGDRRVMGVGEPPLIPTVEAWEPALLDRDIKQEITNLLSLVQRAERGELGYSDLASEVGPFVQSHNPLMRLSNRQTRAGRAQAPFSNDQRVASKLAGVSPEATAQPAPEEPMTGRDAVTQQVAAIGEPPKLRRTAPDNESQLSAFLSALTRMIKANEVTQQQSLKALLKWHDLATSEQWSPKAQEDLAKLIRAHDSLFADPEVAEEPEIDPYDLPAPPPEDDDEELPAPPPEDEEVEAPAPEPSDRTRSAVASAAAGERPSLADLLRREIPGAAQQPDSERLGSLLLFEPEEAEDFVRGLQQDGIQPGVVVREIEDAYKALAELENIRGGNPVKAYQKRYSDKMPVIAQKIRATLLDMIDAGEDIQSGPLMAAGLQAQKS